MKLKSIKTQNSLLFGALTLGMLLASPVLSLTATTPYSNEKPRVIVTSDGEIDDECSMVRFLLYANEWDIEGIVTSSSQYHWQGHRWAGDDWIDPYLNAYESVYPNLVKHDPEFPTPQYLRERSKLGNVKTEGEMDEITAGSIEFVDPHQWETLCAVPDDAKEGQSIHIVCEVSDDGSPSLTRYRRVVLNVVQ